MTKVEINKNCENMQLYVQSRFDLMTENSGIIGVTYNPTTSVYDFYLNTNRIASHRSRDFPVVDTNLKVFLIHIARSAANISDMTI